MWWFGDRGVSPTCCRGQTLHGAAVVKGLAPKRVPFHVISMAIYQDCSALPFLFLPLPFHMSFPHGKKP